MKENWAKSLKQRMAGFEQPVDDALWAGIARVSVNAGIRWWPWVTTALAFAAVITIVLLLRPEHVVEPIVVSSEETVASVEEEPRTETLVTDNTPAFHRQIISALPSIEAEESFPLKNGNENEKTDTVTQKKYSAKDEPLKVDKLTDNEWVRVIEEESAPRQNRVKITTSFYAQASPFGNRYSAGSTQAQDNQPESPPGIIPSPDHPSEEVGGMDPGEPDDDNNETKGSYTSTNAAQTQSTTASPEWTHAFPLQIGARVSLSWSDHWSIDTGLTFMHFNSWTGSTQQRMEFLGVPLYVNYLIGSARNFSFYASAGGQALKCFAGNAPDKPWMFSCGLGIGAEYYFSPLVSMYAEPGADWYFHTGKSCHYYTDNPFAFSLSLGIRLHL